MGTFVTIAIPLIYTISGRQMEAYCTAEHLHETITRGAVEEVERSDLTHPTYFIGSCDGSKPIVILFGNDDEGDTFLTSNQRVSLLTKKRRGSTLPQKHIPVGTEGVVLVTISLDLLAVYGENFEKTLCALNAYVAACPKDLIENTTKVQKEHPSYGAMVFGPVLRDRAAVVIGGDGNFFLWGTYSGYTPPDWAALYSGLPSTHYKLIQGVHLGLKDPKYRLFAPHGKRKVVGEVLFT